jgi:hypothetical protein
MAASASYNGAHAVESELCNGKTSGVMEEKMRFGSTVASRRYLCLPRAHLPNWQSSKILLKADS